MSYPSSWIGGGGRGEGGEGLVCRRAIMSSIICRNLRPFKKAMLLRTQHQHLQQAKTAGYDVTLLAPCAALLIPSLDTPCISPWLFTSPFLDRQVGDNAVLAIAAGSCRKSLRRLDLTGTAVKGPGLPSLRSLGRLEYLALSSTDSCVSVMSVAALARDLGLPACLPEAPKTRGRCSRSLLRGSQWSERQLRCLPRKRMAAVAAPARSWQGGAPSKAMRLIGAARRAPVSSAASSVPSSSSCISPSSASDDLVKVGFRGGSIEEGDKQYLLSLIQGIVRLWPAVPSR